MKTRSLRDVVTTMHSLISVLSSAFLTGTVRISGEGMDNYVITIIDPDKENPDQEYPIIYTCTKSLFLPRYTDKHILKERLFLILFKIFIIGF
uniref:HECT domain-containing protein n=1 Tax=Naja naja TaxID=35670 RepID=A0A8C7DTY1_NAJNA